jgi:hypothetical protein
MNFIKMFLKIFLALFLVFMISCSSEKTVKEKEIPQKMDEIFQQEVIAEFTELNLWVNLMPNSDGKLHVSGIVGVNENFDYDINFIRLQDVVIKQDSKMLFMIKPIVQLDPNLSNNNKKIFRFSTSSGMSLNPEVDLNKNCDLEFHFYDGNKLYKYLVDNVKIEKTY